MQARLLERLLVGSSSSLSSSGQSAGLAAVGRAISTGAEGSSGPAPAAASSPVNFPFHFFEKTRCISGNARLSGDFSQTGWHTGTVSAHYIIEAIAISSLSIEYGQYFTI